MDAEQQCLIAEASLTAEFRTYNGKMRKSEQIGPVTDPASELAASGGQSQSASKVKRRWTVIASGLLLLALALVVIYTDPNAFLSPTALVVVAAIGFAALLLQVWFRRDLPVHSPLWLNVLGILCALISLFGDYLRLTRRTLDLVAFTAVLCFGISGSLILHSLRKRIRTDPQAETE